MICEPDQMLDKMISDAAKAYWRARFDPTFNEIQDRSGYIRARKKILYDLLEESTGLKHPRECPC